MSHKLSQLAFLTITVVLFDRVMVAQISALEGVVKGQDGSPLRSAVIRIDRMDISARYQTRTDKNGHFFYNGLPLGRYRVTCNVDGTDVDAVEVRTQLGDPIQVDFDLRATARKDEKPQNSPDRSPGLGSVYVNAQNAADRLQLNTDGSFSLQEGGQSFTGIYVVAGSTLKLHIAQLQKDVDILVQGDGLVVNGEEVWSQPGKVSSERPATGPSLQFVGHYVYENNAQYFLDLKPDGSYYLVQRGKSYTGRFTASSDSITLIIGGSASKAQVIGETIKDDEGMVWVKQNK